MDHYRIHYRIDGGRFDRRDIVLLTNDPQQVRSTVANMNGVTPDRVEVVSAEWQDHPYSGRPPLGYYPRPAAA